MFTANKQICPFLFTANKQNSPSPRQIPFPAPSSSHKNYKKKQNKFPILETNYYICTVKLNSKTRKLIKPRFDVIMLQEEDDFLASLDTKVRNKIIYNARKSSFVLDNELFKKLEGSDIWEFRTLYNGICYRLLAFWDTEANSLVLATHGFIKKTNKTPKNEIERAETIRKEYFNNKKR